MIVNKFEKYIKNISENVCCPIYSQHLALFPYHKKALFQKIDMYRTILLGIQY